ncbi:MAG TPA: hypothetical protein VFZ73_08860 [Gemmatimonadaceae bacterium]
MRLQTFAAFVAFIAVAACSSASPGPTGPVLYTIADTTDSLRVRVGQTVIVEGLRVRFEAVDSDSRCPIDAVCVWAGDAVASFIVEQNCECGTPAYELELHTTLEPKSGTAYGIRVELLHLMPSPSVSSPIKKDAYSAWIRLTRAG